MADDTKPGPPMWWVRRLDGDSASVTTASTVHAKSYFS